MQAKALDLGPAALLCVKLSTNTCCTCTQKSRQMVKMIGVHT